jgi:two-component system, OmpR family, response regulator
MRILVVEDQLAMAALIAKRVSGSGFVADHVASIGDAIEALKDNEYALVLLDRRLPDGDGVSALPAMRKLRPGVRILLLTALSDTSEKIRGLDAGADDYLTKPVDADEMMARIRACLRRPGGESQPSVVVGELSFDLDACQAFVRGKPFALQKRELTLLSVLMRRAGRTVAHRALVDEVYGLGKTVQEDALRMLVSRLRQHLNEANAGVNIDSARGIGYILTKSQR